MTASVFGQTRFDELARYWHILLPVALGLTAIYALLPRARPYPKAIGLAFGLGALILAGLLWFHGEMMVPERILFYALSGLAILGAGLFLTQTNPVHAALSFALVVLSTCGLFLLQAAPFLMAATIIIYAGAIIVTFLFVIMLAQQEGRSSADMRSREPFLAAVAGFVLLGALLCVLERSFDTSKLDGFLDHIEKAAQAKTKPEIEKALGGDFDIFRKNFKGFLESSERPNAAEWRGRVLIELDDLAKNLAHDEPGDLVEAIKNLHTAAVLLRRQQGSLHPNPDLPLSSFSGAPPNAPPVDPKGNRLPTPVLPADNVAAVGRSLFGDYLLAVELAGMLLTVATIGAIVIAGRRTEGLR